MRNEERGWSTASPKPGYNQGQLRDELYHRVLAFHNTLWRYVIQRYPDEENTPLLVIGYSSIPIGIELSQWTYPVTYITDTLDEVKKAKKDCEIQAGFFKDFLYHDFIKNCPRARVAVFVGILDKLSGNELFDFIDMLLSRVREIVVAVPASRNWDDILEKRYLIDLTRYPTGNQYLLTIKEND